jgi:hypothetical protein
MAGTTILSVPLVPLWRACGQLYVYISGFNKNCANNVLKLLIYNSIVCCNFVMYVSLLHGSSAGNNDQNKMCIGKTIYQNALSDKII